MCFCLCFLHSACLQVTEVCFHGNSALVQNLALRQDHLDQTLGYESLVILIGHAVILCLTLDPCKTKTFHEHRDQLKRVLLLSLALDLQQHGASAFYRTHAVFGSLQCRRIQCKIQVKCLALYVYFCNMHSAALKALPRPRGSCLYAAIGKQLVLNFGIVILYRVLCLYVTRHKRTAVTDLHLALFGSFTRKSFCFFLCQTLLSCKPALLFFLTPKLLI